MSLLSRFLPVIQKSIWRSTSFTSEFLQPFSQFHSITSERISPYAPGGLFNLSVRTIIRNHFPRPSERKRIKRHGWETRMKTASGRRVLMNRILKGRHVYSH
ncbi:large ribosomal subunit protein bL34m [Leptinotarsa decemlineata]|uniref:large ribosomal subunit protein bL34m n=1 Tax=Leptinotarsa decemlineata TaxID=7539 RepID=UPI003D30D427